MLTDNSNAILKQLNIIDVSHRPIITSLYPQIGCISINLSMLYKWLSVDFLYVGVHALLSKRRV